MPTIQQYTTYLQNHRRILNMSVVASRIKMTPGNLYNALDGKKNDRGRDLRIPARCLPYLEEIFNELGVKLE